MRFSIYIGKRIFCIIKPQKFINPQKKQTFPKPGKPAENDFDLSRLGNGPRKSDSLKPCWGKAAGKFVG
jgi:hypothetical protein